VAEAVLQGRLSGSDKSLHKKDFVKAAQADGFQIAEWARRLDPDAGASDVPAGDRRACFLAFNVVGRASGPAFLEVIIDPDAGVYPMVRSGPGLGYDWRR
jgi:acetolactate synthase-1/2/3 large subunit